MDTTTAVVICFAMCLVLNKDLRHTIGRWLLK